jgi:chromosomal replication initiation ATPase DnaA
MKRDLRRYRRALEDIAAGKGDSRRIAEQALDGLYPGPPIDELYAIKRLAAGAYGTTVCDIVSRRQDPAALRARHMAMWLSRRLLGLSSTSVGASFDRDHATVLYVCRCVTRRLHEYIGEVNDAPLLMAIAAAQKRSAAAPLEKGRGTPNSTHTPDQGNANAHLAISI